ncbi:hypothetical protein NLN82_27315 [Citrobacter portucalensis]|uniref:hypothetical protein n=1 Tax=Citrobacter portucalensis TaxID=1639133 RepID=UPI00226B6C76|nr:hypothetical protein [Citrobacter portucalensis]MCX9039705.1 hypothetical protein [Citrobacter portucalensis]
MLACPYGSFIIIPFNRFVMHLVQLNAHVRQKQCQLIKISPRPDLALTACGLYEHEGTCSAHPHDLPAVDLMVSKHDNPLKNTHLKPYFPVALFARSEIHNDKSPYLLVSFTCIRHFIFFSTAARLTLIEA